MPCLDACGFRQVEPRVYLQYVFDHYPALVAALQASQGEADKSR